jgi:hypothetical protein
MPSKRTSAIVGIWVIVAVLIIVDAFLFSGFLLDSFLPGLSGIMNVLIFALIPFGIASYLIDRRTLPEATAGTTRRPPQGARSASGQPMTRSRPQPRIKRGKRAEQLETIVVEPGAVGNTATQANSLNSAVSAESLNASSSSRYLRARRTPTEETAERDQQVQEQLDAIELEMAKLEEQLEQNGISAPPSSSASNSDNSSPVTNSAPAPVNSRDETISREEATSELQAIDELLARLEQRKRAGGVEEETYQRLREKYLKRRSELA